MYNYYRYGLESKRIAKVLLDVNFLQTKCYDYNFLLFDAINQTYT